MGASSDVFPHRSLLLEVVGRRQAAVSRVLGREGNALVLALPELGGRFLSPGVGSQVALRPVGGDEEVPSGTDEEVPSGTDSTRSSVPGRVVERRLRPLPALVVAVDAADLTALVDSARRNGTRASTAQVWAVTSGKGGTGKTTMSVNLALALTRLGKRVALIDVDLGTADVDVHLKVASHEGLSYVTSGQRAIADVLVRLPSGLAIVPGASGLSEVANLSEWQFARLLQAFATLEAEFDVLLLDTGAGLSRNVTNFFLAADAMILVTNPEPPALVDAYALLKAASGLSYERPVWLVLNQAESSEEATQAADKLRDTALRFLAMDVAYVGYVPKDHAVSKAVKSQEPVLEKYPASAASRAIQAIASHLVGGERKPARSALRVSYLERLRALWT